MSEKNQKGSAVDWLISGRGYILAIIYTGHVLQAYFAAGFKSTLPIGHVLQVGVIPFFIVLSGAFYSRSNNGFCNYARMKLLQRYLPVLLCGVLVLPFYDLLNERMYRESMRFMHSYLFGIPTANWPTWFLVALMSSELVYFFIAKYQFTRRQLLVLAVVLYTLGWGLNHYKNLAGGWYVLVGMTWSLSSVPLFLSCMILGSLYRRKILQLRRWPKLKLSMYFVFALFVLTLFSNLNTEFPESQNSSLMQYISDDMVMMFVGQYGNGFYFFISGIAGIICCFLLAKLLPVSRWALLIGENSLLIFCLNGIFHQALNPLLVKAFPLPSDLWYWGLLYGSVIGLLSITLTLPFAMALQKLLPQLVGKPMLSGPILPALYRK